MGLFYMSMIFLFLLYSFQMIIATANYSLSPYSSDQQSILCHDYESSALLQFKQSFSLDKPPSFQPYAQSKVASWKLEGGRSDCCSWSGVECDKDSGHVTGLDLGSSLLHGSINSSCSLFKLVHLRRLNLAHNHFNYSQIPSEISRLSRLLVLNLSSSFFSGQVPPELLGMSKLTILDLSQNVDDFTFEGLLELHTPSLSSIVQNLTNLEELHLSSVHVDSTVPGILANISSLKALSLGDCGLYGEFPRSIFQLPNLETLSLEFNHNLTGYLPEFDRGSPLKVLKLAHTSFYGSIPDSVEKLDSLTEFDVGNCNFAGAVPPSLGNLTQLAVLSLNYNNFNGWKLSYLGKLTQLTRLDLSSTNLYGELPSSLANLTQLTFIDFKLNHLTGQIPSWIMNLTKLTSISLALNHMQGPIPSSFSKLKNLQLLSLHSNNFSGPVYASTFLGLKNLTQLVLSRNNISLLIDATTNANSTLPKFEVLALGSCNLREFPYFLRFQDRLEMLSLQDNMISGRLPQWISNGSKEETSGFEQHATVLPWPALSFLDISLNMLEGSLPIPLADAFYYSVSNNKFTGEIPPWICRMNSLLVVDLSDNDLSGSIPSCLGNLTHSLSVLNLRGNNFRGTIPQIYSNESKLRMIDLSQNQLEGRLPRSLRNCKMLQILIVGDNQINDTFPFWLAAQPELQVLILRSNKFHGTVEGNSSINIPEFPKLLIIDLSNNGFTGDLPRKYFQKWTMMQTARVDWPSYLQLNQTHEVKGIAWFGTYRYSMTMTNKGVKTEYEKILDIFTAIDLSSNKFGGEIPESVGRLKGLQLLNLSNNHLSGTIPPSIGSLTQLESLDLSRNELLGGVPQELTQLTFLAFLNVSCNHLTGAIPRGRQFDTFQNTSYVNNSALCGEPLSRNCGNTVEPRFKPNSPPSAIDGGDDDDDYHFPGEVGWIVISIGYGSGLVVGLILGQYIVGFF